MKAAPDPEYVLLRHECKAKGFPFQTVRDAASRREFEVVELGADDSRKKHLYVRREDFAAWLNSKVITKRSTLREVQQRRAG